MAYCMHSQLVLRELEMLEGCKKNRSSLSLFISQLDETLSAKAISCCKNLIDSDDILTHFLNPDSIESSTYQLSFMKV